MKKLKFTNHSCQKSDLYYFLDLTQSADATISVTKEFYGTLYETNNKAFNQMTPEEKKIFYQEELSTIAQSASADSELLINFNSYPGRISYTARVPKYGVVDSDFMYFNLPKTMDRIFNLRSDSRDNPLYINNFIRKEIHIIIALPKGFRAPVISPNNFKWNSPMYNGNIEVESILITPLALKTGTTGVPITILKEKIDQALLDSKNILYITMNAKLSPALYPSALYQQVLNAQNKLFSPAAKEVMLKNEINKK